MGLRKMNILYFGKRRSEPVLFCDIQIVLQNCIRSCAEQGAVIAEQRDGDDLIGICGIEQLHIRTDALLRKIIFLDDIVIECVCGIADRGKIVFDVQGFLKCSILRGFLQHVPGSPVHEILKDHSDDCHHQNGNRTERDQNDSPEAPGFIRPEVSGKQFHTDQLPLYLLGGTPNFLRNT